MKIIEDEETKKFSEKNTSLQLLNLSFLVHYFNTLLQICDKGNFYIWYKRLICVT